MTDLIQQLKSLGEVLHGDFTQEQVTSAFTSGAQIILDGRTLDRDGFYAMQKARVSFMDSEPILYHAVAQAGNVVLSHHQVTNTVKSTGQKITLDAFAHVEYEGDRICFFHINIKAPEGVDMKAMFAEMIKQ